MNDSLRSIPTIPVSTTVTNLLIAIKDTSSRKLIVYIAARLGEAESGINRALNGIVPAMLSGLISQTQAGGSQAVHSWSQDVCHAVQNNIASVTGVLGMLGGGLAPGSIMARGESILAALFGAGGSAVVVGPIGNYAGIWAELAVALVQLTSAVMLALLGVRVANTRLTPAGLGTELLGLRGHVREALPSALYGTTSPMPMAPVATKFRASWYQVLVLGVGFSL